MSNAPAQTLEIVSFKLNAKATAESFLEASQAVSHYLAKQPGFLYRSLCEKQNPQGESEWLDVIYWQDSASAQTAAQSFCTASETMDYVSMIEESSVTMQHAKIHSSLCMDTVNAENSAD